MSPSTDTRVIVTPGSVEVIEVGDGEQIVVPGGVEVITVGVQGPPGPPGAGETPYSNSTPVPITLGGVTAGTVPNDWTLSDLANHLLYPYLVPAFTAFSLGQSSPVEVGFTLAGTQTFTWAVTNAANLLPDSISITDTTGGVTLGSGLPNTGSASLNVGSIQKTLASSNSWQIAATNSEGNPLSASATLTWLWRVYFGQSALALLTDPATDLPSSRLASGASGGWAMGATGYKWLCFPAQYGTPELFTDSQTGLSVAMATSADSAFFSNIANGYDYGTMTVTNGFGVSDVYNVYRTKYQLGSTITISVS